MGVKRSLLGAYRSTLKKEPPKGKPLKVPGSWNDAFLKFNWHERAEAWDLFEIEQSSTMFERDRVADRVARIKLLKDARQKAADALATFPVEKATLSEITNLIRLVTEGLRSEYDDEPTKRHAVDGKLGGQATIVVVPDYRKAIGGLAPALLESGSVDDSESASEDQGAFDGTPLGKIDTRRLLGPGDGLTRRQSSLDSSEL